jgi:hypothetical protein
MEVGFKVISKNKPGADADPRRPAPHEASSTSLLYFEKFPAIVGNRSRNEMLLLSGHYNPLTSEPHTSARKSDVPLDLVVGVAAEYNSASKYAAPSGTVVNTPISTGNGRGGFRHFDKGSPCCARSKLTRLIFMLVSVCGCDVICSVLARNPSPKR